MALCPPSVAGGCVYCDAGAEDATAEEAAAEYWFELSAAVGVPDAYTWEAGTMDTGPATIWAAAAPARERAMMTEFMMTSSN